MAKGLAHWTIARIVDTIKKIVITRQMIRDKPE